MFTFYLLVYLDQRAWTKEPGLKGLDQRAWTEGPGPQELGFRRLIRDSRNRRLTRDSRIPDVSRKKFQKNLKNRFFGLPGPK